MDLELAGRRVLIAGAATGIGRSTVQTLAAEGCRVAALDIDEGALAQLGAAVGPSVSVVPAWPVSPKPCPRTVRPAKRRCWP